MKVNIFTGRSNNTIEYKITIEITKEAMATETKSDESQMRDILDGMKRYWESIVGHPVTQFLHEYEERHPQ